ncbi:MAG: hypothetical protein CMK37_09120, partial [Porticoccaceae bacterium]|nr:hypothetical protein [Porticoccaceae bacterium]
MENLLLKLTGIFAQAPNRVLEFKQTILAALTLVSLFLFHAIYEQTEFDLSSEAFIDQEGSAQIALDEFRRQFGSDRSVFLIYKPADGDVFSRKSLSTIQELTTKLENWQDLDPEMFPNIDLNELKHIRRVQSLSNLQIQSSSGDTLISRRIVPRQLPGTQAGLQAIKQIALEETDFISAFYAKDGSFGALLLQTDFGTLPVEGYESALDNSDIELEASFDDFELSFDESAVVQQMEFEDVDPRDYLAFNDALSAIYDQYDQHFEYYAVGEPSLMTQLQDVLDQLVILGYLMVLIFTLLLWILFRSGSALVWPLVTIALSVSWCWGITVLLGTQLTSMIGLTILLIFSVGIADCVHVMSAYFSFRRQGMNHYLALEKSYEKVGLAILLTTLTTASGILVLATSNLEPIRVFAYMCAFGVVLAFFFTVVLLPILLNIWHPTGTDDKSSMADRLGRSWHAKSKNIKRTIATVVAISIFASLGLLVGAFINLVILLTYWIVNYQQQILSKVPGIVDRQPYFIMLIFSAIFILCCYGSTKIQIDTNVAGLFR